MVVGLFRGEAAAAGKRSPTCCLLLSTCCLLRTACHLHLPPALATLLLATCYFRLHTAATYRCYILSQRYSGLREKLQESMVTGVSVGDCALLVEERLKNQWGSV